MGPSSQVYSRRLSERSRRRTTPVTARIRRIWSALRVLQANVREYPCFGARSWHVPFEPHAVELERRREEIQDPSLDQDLRIFECRRKTSHHETNVLSYDMRYSYETISFDLRRGQRTHDLQTASLAAAGRGS